MSIKHHFVRLAEKITGRKCSRCYYNTRGRCVHPNGATFCRCWQSIARPGFKYSESKRYANEVGAELVKGFRYGFAGHCSTTDEETRALAPGDMTEEEKYQLGKIVESLQEASATAQDAGLLDAMAAKDAEQLASLPVCHIFEDKTESGLLEDE